MHINNYTEYSKTVYSYQTLFKHDKEQKLKNIKNKTIEKDTDKLSYRADMSVSINEEAIANFELDGGVVDGFTNNQNDSDEAYVMQIKNRIDLEKNTSKIITSNPELYQTYLSNIETNDNFTYEDESNDDQLEMIGGNDDTENDNEEEIELDLENIENQNEISLSKDIMMDINVVDEFDI